MATLEVTDAPSWTKFVTDFRPTKKVFDENYAALLQLRPYIDAHPSERPEYDRLMFAAVKHKKILDTLQSIYNTVSGWLSSVQTALKTSGTSSGWGGTWGSGGGFGEYADQVGAQGEDDALGLLPIVWGVATALAALAAIGYWVKDAYQFSRRLNELQRLEATGMSPADAARVVNKTIGSGNKFFGIDIKWLIIGGAMLIFGPTIIRMLKAR